MIRNARFHRGRDSQGAMNLAEVVPCEVERNRRAVIFQLL
jgi:hypothetical protein